MDTTDNTELPKRRIEDQAQAATLNWDAPGAPAVPAAQSAPARIPLRAVASMCVNAEGVSVYPTPAADTLAPGHYMLSAQGADLQQPGAGASQVQAAAPSDLQQLKAVALAAKDDAFDAAGMPSEAAKKFMERASPAVVIDLIARLNDAGISSGLAALAQEQTTERLKQADAHIEELEAQLARQQAAPALPTEISGQLREFASNPGYSHGDYADVMRRAADECDRFYGGMMAWKKTAQKKDADWNEARMARENDRVAARLAAPAAIPEGWTLTRKTHGVCNRYVVECARSIRSFSEDAEPTLFRFFEALAAAPAHPAPIEAQGLAKQFGDPTIAPAASGDDLRAEFERTEEGSDLNCAWGLGCDENEYASPYVQNRWVGFQRARAAVSAATKPTAAVHQMRHKTQSTWNDCAPEMEAKFICDPAAQAEWEFRTLYTGPDAATKPNAEQIAEVVSHLIGNGVMDWKPSASDEAEWDAMNNEEERRALIAAVNKALAATKPAPQQATPTPEGFVLVPLVPNAEMVRAMSEDEWKWEDVLAAGALITEDEYEKIAYPAAPQALLDHAHAEPTSDLLPELRSLYLAYVNLLENGRNRIMDLGGDCDPVDRLEADDPALRKVRAIFDRASAGEVSQGAAPTAADVRDAARYRWLRGSATDIGNVIDKEFDPGMWEYRAGDELDAAIDAARAAQPNIQEAGK